MIPEGSSELSAMLDGERFPIFTYRPPGRVTGFLFVFHGISRNASDQRDFAAEVAKRQGVIVIAPLFDE